MDIVAVITRLRESLDNLEKSVFSAKIAVSNQDVVSAEVIKRISNYEDVISKQRTLVDRLNSVMECGKTDEAMHLIKVINGLSSMIYDDANDLIKTFVNPGKQQSENSELLYN